MAGITNSPFRRLMKRHGSALVISELVSANGIEYAGAKSLDLLKFTEEERVVGLQIFGDEHSRIVKACQVVENLGADFVDLNLGCPVPKVTKKGGGSAMCRNPLSLGKLLEMMVKAVKIPVTIKIRTGWDAETKNALEVVRVAQASGVRWVAIHGRTRAQGYSGLADWDFIGDIKAKVSIPVIGNGDIITAEQAVDRMKTYGVDSVLIGRGALRNPFLFEQAVALWEGRTYARPAADDYVRLIEEQRVLLNESFAVEKVAMLHARKFLAWYAAGFPNCHEFRRKVFSIPEPEVLWQEAYEFFRLKTDERDERELAQPFLMGGHG